MWCLAVQSDQENIPFASNFGEKVCFLPPPLHRICIRSDLDACKVTQIKAGGDLKCLQSNGGWCEGDRDGEDLLGVHHEGGRLNAVFQKVLRR